MSTGLNAKYQGGLFMSHNSLMNAIFEPFNSASDVSAGALMFGAVTSAASYAADEVLYQAL
jgi:hypothetical protein